MFGLFKTKSTEKAKLAKDASVALVKTQLDLASVDEDTAAQRRVMTPYSLGYILGHADAHAQKAGIKDELECMAHITVVHAMLFGTELGPKVTKLSFDLQSNPEFNDGRKAGAMEALRWYSEKDFAPMTLQSYLSGGAAGR